MNEPVPPAEPVTNNPHADSDHPGNEAVFFPVSEGKLITLYLLSFGFYGIYWFYRNWQILAPEMDKKIYPFWRGVFSIFFAHSLFKRIEQKAGHLAKKHKYNSTAMAVIFVLCVVLSQVIDRASMLSTSLMAAEHHLVAISILLFIASTYPMVKVQATVNRLNNDILGYLNHKYTAWNYLLIAVGGFMWAMLILGYVLQALGLAPAQ